MKQLKESLKVPYFEELSVNMSDCDDEGVIPVLARYLETGLERDTDIKDLSSVKVMVDSDQIIIQLSGELSYDVTKRNISSWDYPREIAGPEEGFAADIIIRLLKKYPDNISFDAGKNHLHDDAFLKDIVETTDGGCPTDDDIWDAAQQAEIDAEAYYGDMLYDRYKDARFEGIMKSILAGKSLTEALNERAGDWDIEAQETVSSSDVEKGSFEMEFAGWKRDVAKSAKVLMQSYDDFQSLISGNGYGVSFDGIKDTPFKYSIRDTGEKFVRWYKNILQYLDKINPYN